MTEDDFKFDEDEHGFNPFEDEPKNNPDLTDEADKEVNVTGVYEHRSQDGSQQEFVVLLRDKEGRAVPIVIGRFEAIAISLVLEGFNPDRPMTHDLLNSVITKLGGSVSHILIDDIWSSTYYAKITVESSGKEVTIDSRPSDAIALALRSKAPIFMAERVLQTAALQEE